MTSNVRERLIAMLCDVLQIELSGSIEDLHRSDYELWDSVNHLRLVMDIEETFGITLDYELAADLRSLNQIEAVVDAQLAGRGEPA